MKSIFQTSAAALAVGMSFSLGGAAADTASDPNARDLLILADWFQGEFDNEEQLWFENDPRSNTPEADRHQRVHTLHKRMNAPQFGEHVFYVEEYVDHDPAKIIRQRIVIFESDLERSQIRMRQGFFANAESLVGAHKRSEVFESLTDEDVFFIDTCDVFWRRVADQFEGKMDEKACVFGDGDKRRYSVHNLTLSASKYWREDLTYLVADNSFYTGTRPGHPTEMRRADRFICDVTFRTEEGAQAFDDLPIHTQGGTIDVVRESDGKPISLMIRQKEYPYYSERPDFMFFSVRETGQYRSIAYSVTDTDARRIGINTAGIGAHCHREGYEFRESLELLDTMK